MCYDKINAYYANSKQLMERWMSKAHAENGKISFAKDGIVSPEKWFEIDSNSERILFVLKEAYDNDEHRIWDETKWILHERCTEICNKAGEVKCPCCHVTGMTFNPIAEWVYGISRYLLTGLTEYDNMLGTDGAHYLSVRDEILSKIAIINIKKSSGSSNSSADELFYYAALDKELLIEQINLIQPTLIICGGTYNVLRCLFTDLPALEDPSNGHTMYGKIKIVATCHPNARRKTSQKKYEQTLENYKKLM